jgi:hypothetical protein
MTYDPSSPYGPSYGQDPSQPWQQPGQQPYGQPGQPYGQQEPQYGQPPQSPYGPPVDSPYSAPPVPSPGPSYPPPAYPTSGQGYAQPGYPTPAPQPPKKSNTGLIIALVAVILVVICGGGIAVVVVLASKSKPVTSPTHGPGPTSRTTGAPAPTNTGGGGVSGSGTVPFGADHGVEWNDHIQASVLSAQRFTPSSTAHTHPGQVGVKVTVKITNNSSKQLDLTLAQVKLKSGDNGTQADDIIDIENNITLGFEGAVAPGHSATAVYAFSVPPDDLNKLDIEVSPGFDYDAGIFEGAAS